MAKRATTRKAPEAPAKPKPAPRRKKTPGQVLAERHPGVSPEQVEKYRVEDGAVVYLINWGIKGIKKYRVPLSEFGQRATFFK